METAYAPERQRDLVLYRLRGSGNDVAYRNWSAQHAKPKPRDFGRRDGAEPGENEYAIRLHQLAQLT